MYDQIVEQTEFNKQNPDVTFVGEREPNLMSQKIDYDSQIEDLKVILSRLEAQQYEFFSCKKYRYSFIRRQR